MKNGIKKISAIYIKSREVCIVYGTKKLKEETKSDSERVLLIQDEL